MALLFLSSTGAFLVRCLFFLVHTSSSFLRFCQILFISIIRSEQVFQNTMHAITAGTVSTWWFVPDEASCCCSKAIMSSTVRATTGSFGSICFGSLLVAIIQTLRALVESLKGNDDVEGCAAFLLCLVSCILRCIEGMLEYFNKYAYIYVGMVSLVSYLLSYAWFQWSSMKFTTSFSLFIVWILLPRGWKECNETF